MGGALLLLLAMPASGTEEPDSGSAVAGEVGFLNEFLVNTYTTGWQQTPRVAGNAQGDFVVVWRSAGSPGTDTSNYSVQARRFEPDGAPSADQFQVNTGTTDFQWDPAVAFDGQGRYVVVWAYRNITPTASNILAQRYDSAGNPLGAEFQVNTLTNNYQLKPAVAADALGDFVVAWESGVSAGGDTSQHSIQARRFDSSGAALGDQFQVNTHTPGNQAYPDIAADSQGGFVVVWRSPTSPGTDTLGESIQARRFASNGSPIGAQFQVNSYTTSSQTRPAVAIEGAGDFTVVWYGAGSAGNDTVANQTSIHAQRYAANGSTQGGEIQVNTYTTGFQDFPRVASDADGNVIVVWKSDGSDGGDSSMSIQSQRYQPDGTPLCPQIQLNHTWTVGNENLPAVAAAGDDGFVAAWQTTVASPGDANYAVIALRLGAVTFCHGFESGSTSGWSSVAP